MPVTGMQFADSLRDAAALSGGTSEYVWVRAWNTVRGVPLGIAAEEAADAAGQEGLLAFWLRESAQALRGKYTVCAAEFARVMEGAGELMRRRGAVLFPAAARNARDAECFAAWSASAYAGGMREIENARADERVFLPWLRAMDARYAQE